MNMLKQLYTDFMTILDQCVIKYQYYADLKETLESQKKADEYINAKLLKDTFNTYYRYDVDVLKQIFPTATDEEILLYNRDRNKIPITNDPSTHRPFRTMLLEAQRNKIITQYEMFIWIT